MIRKKAKWIEKLLQPNAKISPFSQNRSLLVEIKIDLSFPFNLPSKRINTRRNSVPKKASYDDSIIKLFPYEKTFARIRTIVIGIELLVNFSLLFGDRYHLLVGFKHVKRRTIERGFGFRPRIVSDLDRPDEKRFGAPLYLRSICRKISSVVNCGILTNCPSVRL